MDPPSPLLFLLQTEILFYTCAPPVSAFLKGKIEAVLRLAAVASAALAVAASPSPAFRVVRHGNRAGSIALCL